MAAPQHRRWPLAIVVAVGRVVGGFVGVEEKQLEAMACGFEERQW